jgi:type IV secretion system protein VirD4
VTPPSSPDRSAATGPLWMLLGVVCSVVVVWHAAVLVAATVSGARVPRVQESTAAILRSPGDPLTGYANRAGLPSAWLVWPLFALGMALVCTAAWWWMFRRHRLPRREGVATRRQLDPFLSERAARLLAKQTRPRMTGRDGASMEELAVALGTAEDTGQRLYASHEDSFAIVGGPRVFKTSAVLTDLARTAPGPLVAASTKAELLSSTYTIRERRGVVHVFDPTNVVGWPTRLRWSPVFGCADPEAAMARAEGFAAAIPKSDATRNAAFFEDQARDVLRCFLHAAALTGASMRDVIGWVYRLDSPTLPPREILRTHPKAVRIWATELEALTSGDAVTGPLDSTKKTLARLVAPFAAPEVLDACSPPAGKGFDVEAFLDSRDSIYIMAGDGGTVAPLVTAFVTEIVRVAKRMSQRLSPARLDPPLRIVIDEVANVCPLPDLPSLMSDTGGRGLTVAIGSQGLGQARKRWGPDGADEVFGSATAKIIMGGTSEPDFLEKMSQLADEVEVSSRSTTISADGGTSSTMGSRSRRVIRPGEIRTLPPGSALVLYRQAPPVITRFLPWWESSWAEEARASQIEVSRLTARWELERP